MKHPLSTLKAGESASVASLVTPDPLRRRLLDLGFTPGARVCCLFTAPSGDPQAFVVRNTVIALRKSDAATVLTEA